MIKFTKKTATDVAPAKPDDNRFEQVRKAAAEGHAKSEAEKRQVTPRKQDDRLL